MMHYILQTVAFQLAFLLLYDVFLKRETFFRANRWYLLLTPILSFILPFIKIDAIREQLPEAFLIQLPAVLVGSVKEDVGSITLEAVTIEKASWYQLWTFGQWVEALYFFGMGIALLFFGYKILKLWQLKRSGRQLQKHPLKVIQLPATNTAFSFFNTIFIGENLSEVQQKNILLHEQVHIKEGHSFDLLFFELLRIVCWFNPLIYVFQNRMELLQEFTADAYVVAQKDKKEYYGDLLAQVFQTESISFINTFFNHSFIKKRIIMLQKSKSKQLLKLKYLALIPAVCAMLLYTSCSDETKVEEEVTAEDTSEVMTKINELSEAIMKKGDLTDEEAKALQFLTTEAKPGDRVYESVQGYLDESKDNIPFAVIDKVPVFPGCEGMSNDEAKTCFSEKITEFIVENFEVDNLKDSDLSGRQKIMTSFVVQSNGEIRVEKIRAEHPDLEAEALWTLGQLPKMIPGEHNGKKVNVLYSLPIIFAIE